MMTIRGMVSVLLGLALSVMVTVMVFNPGDVGVPDRTPVPLKVNPGGIFPVDRLNVYGGVPPEAVYVAEYGVPTTPPGKVAGGGASHGTTAWIAATWRAGWAGARAGWGRRA